MFTIVLLKQFRLFLRIGKVQSRLPFCIVCDFRYDFQMRRNIALYRYFSKNCWPICYNFMKFGILIITILERFIPEVSLNLERGVDMLHSVAGLALIMALVTSSHVAPG